MEEYPKAESLRKELCELSVNLVNRNFSFMSERQRELYWNTVSGRFEGAYSLSYVYPVGSVTALNYNNALFAKGLLLRSANAVRDAIYSSENAGLIERYDRLRSIREQISALQQKDDADEGYLQSLETEADALDKVLTQESAAFRDLKADMALQWREVQQSLGTEDAAVEFLSFRLYDKQWTDRTVYAALVLRPGMDAPAWIPLCEEPDLQEILSRAEGRKSDQQARIIYDVFGSQLYDTVWKPLEEALNGVKRVYYAPSGLLHKIAFSALPADDAERLADKYDLNLVSSTREVVHFVQGKTDNQRISSAVLYGGVNYDTPAETMRIASAGFKTGVPGSSGAVASVLPSELTRGSRGLGFSWEYLKNSLPEVQNIEGYLTKNQVVGTLYQDSDATEESFKALDGAKTKLIHIATHGYFLPDLERDYEEPERSGRSRPQNPQNNPLIRSMLMFSGANHASLGEPVDGAEDGILTADEIARLNLIGAQLVVLSACQTGLGDVKNSEGVFGLQRAFKLAGVETLIMSLWEVSDEATAKLMSAFYSEWLSGKRKQEAFKSAQRQVRAEYPAPFFWAAFVMLD
jgi:CHAT domain-containing protein